MRNPYFENLGSGVALLKDSEYRDMLLGWTPFSIRALNLDCDEVHRYSDAVYIHVSPVWSGVNLLFLLSLSFSVRTLPPRGSLIRSHFAMPYICYVHLG